MQSLFYSLILKTDTFCEQVKWLMIFLILVCVNSSCTTKNKDAQSRNLSEIDKEIFNKSFKQILKDKKVNENSISESQYEDLQTGNIYSNYFYNVYADFPDKWICDRGLTEYNILRAFHETTSSTVSLSVVPGETPSESSETSKFQSSPILYLNRGKGKDHYKDVLLRQIKENLRLEPYDFYMTEQKAGATNFLKYKYKVNYEYEKGTLIMETITYQTQLWDLTFTLSYSAPFQVFDPRLIDQVLYSMRFSKPYQIPN